MGVHEGEGEGYPEAEAGLQELGSEVMSRANWRRAARRGLQLTYRVEPGVAPSSHGLAVAAQAGVPLRVLDRASEIMGSLHF